MVLLFWALWLQGANPVTVCSVLESDLLHVDLFLL